MEQGIFSSFFVFFVFFVVEENVKKTSAERLTKEEEDRRHEATPGSVHSRGYEERSCRVLGLGFWELLLILLMVLLFFGARKLPQIGEGLGKSISEFKKGVKNPAEKIGESSKREFSDPPEDRSDSSLKG